MRQIFLLLFLVAARALAYTPVQVSPNTCYIENATPATVPITCAFPGPVSANNVLVISVHVRVATATAASVADSGLSTPTTFTQKAMTLGGYLLHSGSHYRLCLGSMPTAV